MCYMIYYTITAISTNQGSLKKLVWYFSISTFLIHSRRNSCFRCNPIQNHNYPYGLTYFENFSLTSFQMLLPTWWIVTQAFCTIWIKFNSICNKLTIMNNVKEILLKHSDLLLPMRREIGASNLIFKYQLFKGCRIEKKSEVMLIFSNKIAARANRSNH